MTPELKQRWMEALESGKYNQVQGCLRRHNEGTPESQDGYCCLGVLWDLAMVGNEEWTENQTGSVPVVWPGDCGETEYEEAELPHHVKTRVGLTDDECSTLMELNDGTDEHEGFTFDGIAMWIKENINVDNTP